ncbi:hypothetical protein FH972_026326 [Carpinus fangiana]|uniref:Uncharacterized protein n=1 Tax=Carpinus fangiana TaxID=176857 RepID=A0A5N6L407_9ROSI|nr:hypothetical protein FH972_026326 [Carpinus fangiana]
MRELKPLILPGVVRAAPNEPCASPEQRFSGNQSRPSSWMESSEPSPVSTTFSVKRHSRGLSSSSSVSSSPPRHDSWDLHMHKRTTAPSPSLPYVAEVAEDPMERDDLHHLRSSSDGFGHWSRHVVSTKSSVDALPSSPLEYADPRDGFYSDSELAFENHAKRRRSADSSFNSFASRIVTRLPSLGKRSRERKRSSLPITPLYRDRESASPILISPRLGRSRSNSRARSIFRRSSEMEVDREALDQQQEFPSQIETIAEDEPLEDQTLEALGIVSMIGEPTASRTPEMEGAVQEEELAEPGDLQRVSTPLLPALMAQALAPEQPHAESLPSPVNSPDSVGMASGRASATGTPQLESGASPALSHHPSVTSVTSFHQRQHLAAGTVADVPALLIADPNDEWSDRLGHANFHIYPAPYSPQEHTVETCNQLLRDWEEARQEYSKHLSRTNTHFGATSQTYRLTEAKWAGIDAQWKLNYEAATAQAAQNGGVRVSEKPAEPAPVAKIPSMNDAHSEGKFPKLGDKDIVGPMTQVAAPSTTGGGGLKRRPSKKTKIMKMLGFMTPSSALNRGGTPFEMYAGEMDRVAGGTVLVNSAQVACRKQDNNNDDAGHVWAK